LNKNKQIVEFFGAAGVGKTMYCKNIIYELKKENYIKTEDFLKYNSKNLTKHIFKIYNILLLTVKNFKAIVKTLKLVIASKQNSSIDFFKNLYNMLYIVSIINQDQKNNKITFFDQGILQSIVSLKLSSKRNIDTYIIDYLNQIIEKKIIIVIVSAPQEVIFKRLNKRKNKLSRIEKNNTKYTFELSMDKYKEVKKNILGSIKNNLIDIIRIESLTEFDIIHNNNEIKKEILKKLN